MLQEPGFVAEAGPPLALTSMLLNSVIHAFSQIS